MDIYIVLLFTILINGLLSYSLNRKHYKKWFVASSFFMIILVAALRSTNIGKDLSGHYAANFVLIANTNWSDLANFTTNGMYDIGFVVFCKVLSFISVDPQCFIVATSLITFASIGLYIYRHSEDVILETFLMITSFLMFMYLTMLAQVLAITVILFAVDFLAEKKYIKFAFLVLLASTLHASAIICFIFIPLSMLKTNRNYILGYVVALCAVIVLFDKLINFVLTYFLPQYSFYFMEGAMHNAKEQIAGSNFTQLLIYVFCAAIGILSFYFFNRGVTVQAQMLMKYEQENIKWLDTGFLIYLSLSTVVFRTMLIYGSVIKRAGYYFYPFAFMLLCRGLGRFKARTRFIIKLVIYLVFLYVFISSEQRLGMNAYGVYPYEFYWR